MFRLRDHFALTLLLLCAAAPTRAEELQPSFLLQIPPTVSHLFIAESDSSTLHRFILPPDGTMIHDERYMSVGQSGVGKHRAWDRRTPLGIYFITERLETHGLHEKYGPIAFPLDYPNGWDKLNERTGDGIWIHGTTPQADRRPPLDTDGCISLANKDLLDIAQNFTPLVTPIIITRNIQWVNSASVAALRDELNAVLAIWAGSYKSGDTHRYLSIYADDFGYYGLNRDEWNAYQAQTLASRSIRDVVLSDVLLLCDPEEEGLFLSRFRHAIVEDDNTVVTINRLYWRRDAAGDLKIIAEDNG